MPNTKKLRTLDLGQLAQVTGGEVVNTGSSYLSHVIATPLTSGDGNGGGFIPRGPGGPGGTGGVTAG